jgi:hypothetical protein
MEGGKMPAEPLPKVLYTTEAVEAADLMVRAHQRCPYSNAGPRRSLDLSGW